MSNPISRLLYWVGSFRKAHLTSFMKLSFSLYGEDVVLKELLDRRGRAGFYVDVGCFHPKRHSNTYMLYRRGWSGINVDMEPRKIDLFRVARPGDFNVCTAVSDMVRPVAVRRIREYDTGSSVAELGTDAAAGGDVINTRTLTEIIDASPFAGRAIDLLSVDAEGHDYPVLKSLDFSRYMPEIVIVEELQSDIESVMRSQVYQLLTGLGYRLRSWTVYSLIFIRPGSTLLGQKYR